MHASYRSYYNIPCASPADIFRHIVAWLISDNEITDYSSGGATPGVGWTLVADNYRNLRKGAPESGDYVVVSTAGISGRDSMFYKLTMATLAAGCVNGVAGLSWNAGSNNFNGKYGSDNAFGPTTGSAFSLHLHGDIESVLLSIGNGATLTGRVFGLVDCVEDPAISLSTAAVSSGSDKTLSVDAPLPSLEVGKKVYIRNGFDREITTVNSISADGLAVTVSSLTKNYAAGAIVSMDCRLITGSGGDPVAAHTYYTTLMHDGQNRALSVRLYSGAGEVHTDRLNSSLLPVPLQITYGTAHQGALRNLCMVSSQAAVAPGSVQIDRRTGASWRVLKYASNYYLLALERA